MTVAQLTRTAQHEKPWTAAHHALTAEHTTVNAKPLGATRARRCRRSLRYMRGTMNVGRTTSSYQSGSCRHQAPTGSRGLSNLKKNTLASRGRQHKAAVNSGAVLFATDVKQSRAADDCLGSGAMCVPCPLQRQAVHPAAVTDGLPIGSRDLSTTTGTSMRTHAGLPVGYRAIGQL